jgi:hypothetical protein
MRISVGEVRMGGGEEYSFDWRAIDLTLYQG